jgi:hypothetical protein
VEMLSHQWCKIIFIGVMLSCVGCSRSASSRLWKATPSQIAGDYASIFHNRGSGDFVTITWLAPPTATAGSQLVAILEKYVLIAVVHSHTNFNQPTAGITFDDIKTLEARDEGGNLLTPVSENELPTASLGLLAGFEAGYGRGFGTRGGGMKFFLFEAGTIRACERGGISVSFDGETYTWETPFPGCSVKASGIGTNRITRSIPSERSARSTDASALPGA